MDCLPDDQGNSLAIVAAPGCLQLPEALAQMHQEVGAVLAQLTPDLAESLIRELTRGPRIFGGAVGRSGFILRGFLMRLMHLGFQVYAVGDTTTPRIRPGDLLLVLSGSGETVQPREIQRRANVVGARTMAITAHPESTIGQEAAVTLVIPGTTKLTLKQEAASMQCPGSLFEQAAFFFLEAVVLLLYQRHLDHDHHQVLSRHADLE
jgi:6-phospho-3-hexuloisomerase